MATGVDAAEVAPTSPTSARTRAASLRPSSRRWAVDLLAVVVCLALAVIAQYTMPSLPGFDPFSWITWGHEIAHHVIGRPESLVLGGGPSWKPLPIVFTTIFGVLGRHALPAWIVFDRAVAFYALYLAYQTGSRLGATDRWAASGPVAGVLAAIAIIIMADLIQFTFRVTSEPMTVTAVLLWLDWHLRGRPLLGLTAGTALSLMRPESAAFVLLYALWYLWKLPLPGVRARLLIVAELVLIPIAWVVPPWIVSGSPNQASSVARDFTGNQGQDIYTIALHRADSLLAWPVIVAALIMVAIAARRRNWLPVGLAVVCVVWLGIFWIMTVKGYPGLTRFLLPPGALVSVLAGAGVAQLAALGGGGLLSAGIAALCFAIAVPFSGGRITAYATDHTQASTAVHSYDAMAAATRRLGGRARMMPCPSSVVAINHTIKTGLAWVLQVPLTRVTGLTFHPQSLHHPALALLGPRNVVIGGAPTVLHYRLQGHLLFQQGVWRVTRVTRPGDSANACVGS